jgi:hypothetical protein
MAAMGKGKMNNGLAKIASRATRATPDRLLASPLRDASGLERLNIVVLPTSQLNIGATVTVGGSMVGGAIMREGFVTETGLLISGLI